MKKSTKILGSVALSAALVMGTAVPAFAVESPNTNDDKSGVGNDGPGLDFEGDDHSTGSASTEVKITTYTSQISVTVPLAVTFSLDTVGGAGYAPSDGAYMIKNGTSVAVKVTKAKATPVVEQGKTVPKYGFGTTTSAVKDGEKASNGSIGDVWASFTPQDSDYADAPLMLDADNSGKDQELNWIIGGKPAGSEATVTGYKYDDEEYGVDEGATNPDDENDPFNAAQAAIYVATTGKSTDSWKAAISEAETWAELYSAQQNAITQGKLTAANAKVSEVKTGSNTTDFKLNLVAKSSKLNKPEATTNNAANIVYTIEVAA